MSATLAAPYEQLADSYEDELQLVAEGRIDELVELTAERAALIQSLPATPPAAAGPALERAALMNKRVMIEILRRREAVLIDLERVDVGRRTAAGYAGQRMRLMRTENVPDGASLGRDILTGRDAVPLLRAGVTIDQRYRDALTRAGIHAVYVADGISEGILPHSAITDETRIRGTRALTSAFEDAKLALAHGRPLGTAATNALSDIVERILREIELCDTATLVLADLACADAYTFQHSIDVTALGLLLGRQLMTEQGWLDFRGVRQHTGVDERLSRLGVGLLLHDIGKLAIPNEVLNKPGKLTEAEWELIKTHPRVGLDLVRESSAWCPLVQAVILRHHERWNGSGYPDGKAGEQIHEMARIAAVADVYDAITSERIYAPARPAHEAVRAILAGAGTLFDPAICELLRRVVAPFPPGVELELEDGRRGLVVSVPEGELDRPVVRVIGGAEAPYEVSLQRDRSIRIAGWDAPPAAIAA
jgi:HD-GYP domain-containing protein (c-di-GMP phosphodiesterase class II)